MLRSFRPLQACTLWRPLSANHITVNNTTAVPPHNNGMVFTRPRISQSRAYIQDDDGPDISGPYTYI